MATSKGLIALIALACLDLSYGQLAGEVCAVNQCPGLETCYNRDVIGQPSFVCECDAPTEMGTDCTIPTQDIDEIFTCYGSQCSSGTFSSPGWPTQVYSARYGGLYLLYIPGATEINFSFDSPFAIEELKDELYVGPGLSFTTAQLDGQTVENDHYFFEGSAIPPSFTVASDTVWMVFLTDKNVQLNGFQIRWAAADNTVPVISNCPNNIALTVELGTTSRVVSWVEPTATDDSGIVSRIVRTHEPNTAFGLGPTTVTYIFEDGNSNRAICSFTVTISTEDNTPPTIDGCPTTQTATAPLGTNSAIVVWVEPTATDLSGAVSLQSRSHIPGTAFSVGTTVVSYEFIDENGRTATCAFNVIVTAESDEEMPVISNCPANIQRTVSLGTTELAVTWVEPTATDNSGSVSQVVRTSSPGDSFSVESPTTVTYVFSDPSGNNAFCQFTITITTVDDVGPTISDCPSNINREVELGTSFITVSWVEPTAVDNSGFVTLISRSHAPGDAFPVGPTTVIYQFQDAAGNPAICSFVVTVNTVDNVPPTISNCPASLFQNVDIGTGGATVTWEEPSATDLSGVAFVVSRSHAPGDFFTAGTSTTVEYVFNDASANEAICTFTVTIAAVDDQRPVISNCPENIEVIVELGTASAVVTWLEPTATDNSGVVNLVTRSAQPGTAFTLGDTTVTYIFSDNSNNINTCIFTITVTPVDTVSPTIVDCPSGINQVVELGTTGVPVVWTEPTATDLSGPVTLVSRSHIPGTTFPITTTLVVYNFEDSSGNPAVCSFPVTITAQDTTPPVISDCPDSIVRVVELGATGLIVSWDEPSATDISGTAFLQSRTADPGDFFVVGPTMVTYTFVDSSGNPAQCSFTVNVVMQDTTPPTISNCPVSFSVVFELGTSGRTVTWTEPTATDLSSVAQLVLRTHQPGDFFTPGETTVRYNFADQEGNIASCIFTVTLIPDDTVPPTISNCPADMTVNVELGTATGAAFWNEPSATDLSGQVTLVLRTASPGDLFPLGGTTVIYEFVDSSGNSDRCTFTVTVTTVDTTPPTISNCPDNIEVIVELGTTSTTVAWVEPTATDLSGQVILVTRTNQPSTSFQLGAAVVTYRFEDNSGNPAVCSFTVTVVPVDTVPPTILNGPGNIVETVELGVTSAIVTWTEPTATDISGTQTLTSRSHAPGTPFPIGTTTVTYTYTDASGNPSTYEFTVTVVPEDTIPPTILNGPDNIVETVELGVTSAVVSWIEPTATDISGTQTLTSRSHAPGTPFPIGTTTVSYTYTDASGNPSTYEFTVTVIPDDTTPPTISNCPSNIEVVVELGSTNAVVTWIEPTATDLSGVVSLVGRTAEPGTPFPLGSSTVTYIFVDDSGNDNVCSFTVTVSTTDTMPPVISNCPQNIFRTIELGTAGSTVGWLEPTATDLSGSVTLAERSHAPGETFPVGTTVVTYNFVDASGINSMCSFLVTITEEDTIPPTILNGPGDIVETVELGVTSAVVSWIEPTATDISGTQTLTSRSHAPGTPFPVGTTTVTYTYTDASGNPSTYEFDVTVVPVDTVPPTIINGPGDIVETVELGVTSAVVSWIEPTATDISGTQTLTSRSHAPGTPFPIGTTTVSYTYTDASGNPSTYEFDVTVVPEDTTRPVISNCPDDVSVTIELGLGSAAAFWVEPTATDLSGVVTVPSQTASPGDIFTLGTTTVMYIFTDNSGNSAVCSFDVIVNTVDTTPPVISNCPAPIPLVVELGSTGAVAVWQEPTASDLSGSVTLTERTHAPGSTFPLSSTLVRYTFTDSSGNPAVCSFVVTVTAEDTTPPTIQNCPFNIVETVELGVSSVIINWVEPTAVDASGQVTLTTRTAQPGTAFAVGSRTVVYTFTDSSGNPASCEFVVTIFASDTTPPTIQNCPGNQLAVVELGTNGAVVTWIEPTAFDLSGVANILSQTHQSGTFFSLGTTTVIYMFADASGNTAPCSFDVIVNTDDTVPPTIQGCPSNVLITIELGVGSAAAFWVEPTATDLSGTVTLVSRSNSPGDLFPVGTTVVTYRFADSSGNDDACAFSVIVSTEDTTPPVISNCPSPIPIVVELGVTGSVAVWVEPTATDLSGLVSLTERTHIPGSSFPVGSTVVSYTFIDGAGNPAICSFPITITTEDTTPPTISNCPANIGQTVELGTNSVVVTWVEPTATDASGQVTLTERTNQPGSPFSVTTTTVRYTFTDGSGNPAVCEFLVIVTAEDTMPPTIQNCPTELSAVVELGVGSTAVTWVEPTAVDISGVVNLITRTHTPGSLFSVGPTVVRYTFADASGNPATCSFTILVTTEDTTRPTISNCPSDIPLNVELGVNSATAFWVEPTATDLSGVVTIDTQTNSPGDVFDAGTTTLVTYIFTDSSGNIAICSFRVIVSSSDTTPPVISNCPAPIALVIELGSTGAVAVWVEPTATDLAGLVSLTERTHIPGSTFPVGSTVVSYTFVDSSGNPAICSFPITVTTEDTTPPTIQNCPLNIIETIELGLQSVIINWVEPTAVDASGQVSLTTRTAQPGTAFAVGSRTVVYTFTDSSGNPASCEFTVTVVTTDTTRPVIQNCPANINIVVELGVGSAPAFWVEPTATDLSGAVTLLTQTNSPGDVFPVGSSTVLYTFVDSSDNSNSCSFTVLVTTDDTTPPVISNCPANIPLVIELGSTGTIATWIEPTATDLSGVVNLIERTHIPGSVYPVGTTLVSYRFEDSSGNPAVCSFIITVSTEDTTPPTIQNCPANIVETIELGLQSLIVSWLEPTAVDASGQVSLTARSQIPGTAFIVGSTTVTYEFTDSSGNPAVCEFIVTILTEDTTPPTISQCPSNIQTETDITSAGSIVTWVQPTATDLSGITTIIQQSAQSGSFFTVGVTEVRIEFADSSGNSAVCIFTITVIQVDDTRPTIINCSPNLERIIEVGIGGTEVFYTVPQATDDSGTATLVTESHTPGQFFPVGTTGVTYIFADPSGNTEECLFTITVTEVDTTVPVLSGCPGNIVQQVPLGTPGTIITWTEPQVSDNSGIVNLVSQSHTSGSFFGVGETIVIYMYADPADNEAQCSFTVTIIEVDNESPTPSCPSDITVTVIAGEGSRPVTWPVPVVTDNSGSASIVSSSNQPGDLFAVGITQVTYTFVDGSGNDASCQWDVIVVEANPCSPDPCQNGAACVITSETEFFCVCPDCFSGTLCEFATSACTNNLCSNGGACMPVAGSCTQYTCECPSCFIGAFCDIPVDACDNNQCQNGGQCVQDSTCIQYTCQCPPCFTGRFCEFSYNACDDNACLNGAACTSVAGSCTEYTCTCPSCFTGAFCEIAKTACNPNPCQNNGNCVTSFDSSCFAYTCQCQGCFTGFNCEVAIPAACDANPCLNGAVCSEIPGTCGGYQCQCQPGFAGTRCEEFSAINLNPCNSSPCENGATCHTMDGNYYICVCRDGYSGINCGSLTVDPSSVDPNTGFPSPGEPAQGDPSSFETPTCTSNPCLNGATCRESYNSNSSPQGIYVPQYTCICFNGFTGPNCQLPIVDAPSLNICNLGSRPPCENGGVCANNYHSYDQDVDYFCFCPAGFIGHNCETETTNPCDSSPCQNDAICTAFNTYFTCTCQTGFSGTTCETVNSADITGPTVPNCPSTISVNVPVGTVGEVTWTEPIATDASGTAELVYQSRTPGSQFSVGTTPVAYVFVDYYGNPTVCLFFVRVTSTQAVDTTRPVITGCPENILVEVPVGATSGVAFWVEPTATDNSQVTPTRTTSATPGSAFNLGTNIVTYIFTDPSGNEARCSFNVVIAVENTDTTGPVISGCPEDIVVTIPSGMFGSTSWTAPTATDESGVAQLVSGPATSAGFFAVGTTTVRYVFEDGSGNQAVCDFDVTVTTGVVDNTPPVISGCPNTVVVTTAPGATTAAAFWNVPTASDDSGMVTLSSATASPGDSFLIGSTDVSYTFRDPSGNPATCTFAVVVMAGTGDVTPPTISNCPGEQTVSAQSGLSGAIVSWVPPTATDASGIASTVSNFNPGDFFPLGLTVVNYQFTDNANLVSECSFSVIVVGAGSDTTAPVISNCPSNIVQNLPTGSFASVSWTAPTAVDETSEVTVVGPAVPSGFFGIGTTTVMYTFRDAAGNEAFCDFTVTIVSGGGDVTNPTIFGCPGTVLVTAAPGATSAAAFWNVPTATDDSGTASLVSASASPGDVFLLGVTEVAYLFSDPSGNEETCAFNVVVTTGVIVDNDPPVISGCPGDIFQQVTPPTSGAIVNWVEPTATDAISGVTVDRTAVPGSFFGLGATLVMYTFTDASGNDDVCQFTVTITSAGVVNPLVIQNCPVDPIERIVSSIDDEGDVSWTPEPTATSGFGEVTVAQSHSSGDLFPVGTTTVTYSFTDVLGNQANCSFLVVVIRGPNACSGNPCSVGEACFYSSDQFLCLPSTATGRRRRDLLSTDEMCPCKNNGTCHSQEGIPGAYCKCPPGFSGILCNKVEIYLKKGEPQMRIDNQWSMVAVMGILVVVILVLAFTLYSMSARVAAAGGKRPDEVAIIH